MRSKRTPEGGQVEVDPLEPIDHRRRLERGRQLGADLLGHDRLDAQQRRAVEGLRLVALGRRDRGRASARRRCAISRTASQSISLRAGAAHDLARGDARAEGEQPADQDARAEAGGMS